MPLFRKKQPPPTVLLASQDPEIFPLIPRDTFRVREAFSTIGVLDALDAAPALVIVDPDGLVEYADFSVAALRASLETLQADGIAVVSGGKYKSDHEQLLSAALLANNPKTAVRFLPRRTVLVANYAGGVGKTTLSMAIARRFREVSGLGAALVEMGVGGSALKARVGSDIPSLYAIVTQDEAPGQWERVDLYPLDGRELRVLADAEQERTMASLEEIRKGHTLTVFDASPVNPLWPHLFSMVTDIVVVTTPRPDSIAQTESMLVDLQAILASTAPQPRLHLVLNMARSLGDRISLSGQVSASLPFNERKADRYDRTLADPVLALFYDGWAERKKRGGR